MGKPIIVLLFLRLQKIQHPNSDLPQVLILQAIHSAGIYKILICFVCIAGGAEKGKTVGWEEKK